jgi:AcrR family transcriptional regulator
VTTRARRGPRRTEALTKASIVEAATHLLDADGEHALTLRALSAQLHTGHGAIYHHVADMSDVLAAATDEVVATALRETPTAATDGPRTVLRALALGLFDAIDAHPWAGAQVSTAPWRPVRADIYETVGEQLHAFGVPERHLSDAAGVLVNHILGVAGQNAANAQAIARREEGREAFLLGVADQWAYLDPARYPRLHQAANHVAHHDDREQLLAGVELILAGIDAIYCNHTEWFR